MTNNQIFICTPVREHDSSGKLTRSGLEWNERTHINTNLRPMMALAYIIGAGLLLIGFFALPSLAYGPEPFIPLLLGLASCGLGRWLQKRKPPIRSVIFTADNQTLTPQGIPGHPNIKQLANCPPSSIEAIGGSDDPQFGSLIKSGGGSNASTALSIAASALQNIGGIRMITATGEVEYLAEGLHNDSAFKVSRQLTIALQELRDANPNLRLRL